MVFQYFGISVNAVREKRKRFKILEKVAEKKGKRNIMACPDVVQIVSS